MGVEPCRHHPPSWVRGCLLTGSHVLQSMSVALLNANLPSIEPDESRSDAASPSASPRPPSHESPLCLSHLLLLPPRVFLCMSTAYCVACYASAPSVHHHILVLAVVPEGGSQADKEEATLAEMSGGKRRSLRG